MGTQTQDFLHIGADGGRVVIYQRPDGGYFGVITGELIPAEFATEEERREQRRPSGSEWLGVCCADDTACVPETVRVAGFVVRFTSRPKPWLFEAELVD